MFTIELLPAKGGDCLWIEYGKPGDTKIVIVDGGERPTIEALKQRIAAACVTRNEKVLDVELMVVTHIDNDHIEGALELLQAEPALIRARDVWFNGKPQLQALPARDPSRPKRPRRPRAGSGKGDLLGDDDDDAAMDDELLGSRISPADLLGPAEGDRLSAVLAQRRIPWNRHKTWGDRAVVVPDEGPLPHAVLEGGMKLTLLGPTMDELYRLSAKWPEVLSGRDEPARPPADLLGEQETWPPVWSDKLGRDASRANGSSIMLLAEYAGESLLLTGDGHAPTLAEGLARLQEDRVLGTAPVSLSAYKVSHHGSSKNVNRDVIERMACSRYLISTDGIKHGHPDHQTMLRILRYSKQRPTFFFNYERDTTAPWRDHKDDVVHDDFQDYDTNYPKEGKSGIALTLGTS